MVAETKSKGWHHFSFLPTNNQFIHHPSSYITTNNNFLNLQRRPITTNFIPSQFRTEAETPS